MKSKFRIDTLNRESKKGMLELKEEMGGVLPEEIMKDPFEKF